MAADHLAPDQFSELRRLHRNWCMGGIHSERQERRRLLEDAVWHALPALLDAAEREQQSSAIIAGLVAKVAEARGALESYRDHAERVMGAAGLRITDGHGEVPSMAVAWEKLWRELWTAGMASFIDSLTDNGLDRAVKFTRHLTAERDRLRAEVAALREGLERIADSDVLSGLSSCQKTQIARAALLARLATEARP